MALHPLDQFRAFLALREKGQSEEEIAAAFFVSAAVVKQRLRLASVSPRLLDAYAEDELTLDQVMAFTVSGDHERQKQVWERLKSAYSKEPHIIRRMLTEGAVRASDKRALFIGVEAYEAAGGIVLRDLFQGDGGGWLQDVVLVDRLVAERLEREAAAIRAEGWHWIEVAPDFPYGHNFGLRQLRGEEVPLTTEEEAEQDGAASRIRAVGGGVSRTRSMPDEVDRRMTEIETRMTALEERPVTFDPAEIARAGAFVSIDADGSLLVERGYVRPEDEMPVAPEPQSEPEADDGRAGRRSTAGCAPDATRPVLPPCAMRTDRPIDTAGDAAKPAEPDAAGRAAPAEPEEEDGIKPLPDRLMAELTTHRTLALRHAHRRAPGRRLPGRAACALPQAVLPLHAGHLPGDRPAPGGVHGAGAGAGRDQAGQGDRARHQALGRGVAARGRRSVGRTVGGGRRHAAASVRALRRHLGQCRARGLEPPAKALAHAGRLAEAVRLDMAAAGWMPTVDTYLGRVTKARILQAVREARGEPAAERIAHLKKGEMAEQAQDLLAGSRWLPEPLRTPGQAGDHRAEVSDAADVSAEQPDDAAAVDMAEAAGDPAAEATTLRQLTKWQSAAD